MESNETENFQKSLKMYRLLFIVDILRIWMRGFLKLLKNKFKVD